MKRIILILATAVLVLPLLLAGPAGAVRVDGALNTGNAVFVTQPMAIDRAELAKYVDQVRPMYAELRDCAACCERIDLPAHRCAACARTATCIRQVVARVRHVQAQLARIDVPSQALSADGRLVEAAATMKASGQYMAAMVQSAPQKLMISAFATAPAGRGGVRVVHRLSPDVVADARLAAMRATVPPAVSPAVYVHARYNGVVEAPRYSATGTPGQQTESYLDDWRDGVQKQAAAVDLDLPVALTD